MSGSEDFVDIPLSPASRLQVDLSNRQVFLDTVLLVGLASEELMAHIERMQARESTLRAPFRGSTPGRRTEGGGQEVTSWAGYVTRAVRIAAALTAIVALGSGVLSWDALRWGAGQLGVDEHLTWIYPLVVDGLIGVGTVAALALRGARRRIRAYVWALLGGAIGASVVGNAAHAAGGNLLHMVGSALPAVALAGSLHLLVILVRESQPAQVPAKVPSSRAPRRAARGSKAQRIRVLRDEATAEGRKLTGAAIAKATGATRQYTNRRLRKLEPADT